MKLKKILKTVDPNLLRVFFPWAIRHPSSLNHYRKLVRPFMNSLELRRKFKHDDILIPPFMILSITKNCNLKCAGCYAAAVGTLNCGTKDQLKIDEWKKIIKEANEIGVFGYIIAGGEPFLYQKLLNLCQEFNDRLFIIITNGTSIKEDDFKQLKKLRNTVVMVSLEGEQQITNKRRGAGVYEKALDTLKRLNKLGVLNGVSVTITQLNYEQWMKSELIDSLIKKGIRIAFFIEYISSNPNKDHSLMLSSEQRKLFREKMLDYRANKKIYLIHSPGDEELFGGCVSAGKGFAHITPSGDLTPCPVSNVATHNLKKDSLKDGLAGDLFKLIRENEHLLETEGTPCALFAHQAEVKELAGKVGAYFVN